MGVMAGSGSAGRRTGMETPEFRNWGVGQQEKVKKGQGQGGRGFCMQRGDPHPSRGAGLETEGICWSLLAGFAPRGLALLGSPGPCPPCLYQGLWHTTSTRVGRQGLEERGASSGSARQLLFTLRGRGFLPEEVGPHPRGQEGAGTGQEGAPPGFQPAKPAPPGLEG